MVMYLNLPKILRERTLLNMCYVITVNECIEDVLYEHLYEHVLYEHLYVLYEHIIIQLTSYQMSIENCQDLCEKFTNRGK